MKIPKWAIMPLITFILMGGLIAVLMVSGCVADDAVSAGSKAFCEINGGLWLDDFNECCLKGCPTDAPQAPFTPAEDAIMLRCNVCWI